VVPRVPHVAADDGVALEVVGTIVTVVIVPKPAFPPIRGSLVIFFVRTMGNFFFCHCQTLNQLFRETKPRTARTRKKERNDDDDEKKEFLSRDDDDAGIVVSDEHHHDESVLVGGRGFDDCRSGAGRNCFWK